MKKYLSLTVFLISLFFIQTLFAQSKIVRLSDDHFQIIFKDIKNREISFLQVTDLHLGSSAEGKWEKDIITFRRIKRLVEMYDPDFIAITGDLMTGEKPFGALLAANCVNFFDSLERPWIYIFGNHDPEGGFGRDKIYEVFNFSKWGILGFHPAKIDEGKKYDFLVDLIIKGDGVPKWQIYNFDSGSHKGFKSIKKDQLDWYRKMSAESAEKAGKQIPAVAFFHIPLIQYQWLWEDKSIKKEGESKEKVCYEEDDGSVYDAFVDVGNIKATFCGHDHYNNYWGTYKGGIILAYGYISGEMTNHAWPVGGKLVKLPLNNGKIEIKNVIPDFE